MAALLNYETIARNNLERWLLRLYGHKTYVSKSRIARTYVYLPERLLNCVSHGFEDKAISATWHATEDGDCYHLLMNICMLNTEIRAA